MARSRQPRRALTALDPAKVTRRPGRSGRKEIWSAVSQGDRWRYVRLEMPGTPWQVTDLHTPGREPDWFTTLTAARHWTWTEDNPPAPPAAVEQPPVTYALR